MVYGTPLGNHQLNASSSVAGSFSYAPAPGTLLNAGTHALSATFTPADSANYNGAGGFVSVTVVKATPSISWQQPDAIVHGAALGASQLNAGSSVAGTFTYSPAAGTVLPAGTHTLSGVFTPDDAANYNAGSASVTLNVVKASPVITWVPPADVSYGAPLSALQLNVNASVPGTCEFSPAPGTILPAGGNTLSVVFTPEDTANYNTATTAVVLHVLRATPIVDWLTAAALTYGAPLGSGQLNATASTAGTFTYAPAAGTVLSAGTHTLGATFAPDDAANYDATGATVVLNVARATSTVTWAAPPAIVYGTPLGAAQLNAAASVPGTFTYSPAAGTVMPAGSHTLSATFTPSDAANYSGSTADVTLTVTKAATSISWTAPNNLTYGTALGGAELDAAASVPGTFAYSPSAGTILPAGSHTLSVTFTPNDPANHAGSTGSQSVTVARALLTVTADNTAKPFGQPLPAFTGTRSGFVNGDSLASLGGTLGYATLATASSGVGSYPITPSGVSSPNYTITFVNGTLTVVRAPTVVAAAASPNPVGFDQPVTFTASVALAAPGLGSPSGYLQFFDGATLIGSVPVTDGPVSLTTAGLPAGTRTLTATYSGDSTFTGSSSTATLTVRTAPASSTVTVSSSANPSNAGQAVTFTAGVSGPAGTISGTVQFFDAATLLGSASIAGTSAAFTTSALGVGGHALTARFAGNASVPPSVSPAFAHTVQASGTKTRATTTAVTAAPSTTTLGTEVAVTATVSGSQNKVPTGTVVFFANGTVIGTAGLSAVGSVTATATLRISTLPRGGHSITGVYLSDAAYRASGGAVKVAVN
jgi:hypothetical protein